MAAVATRKRRTRAPSGAARPGWWGRGAAPWVRWPGVTVEIPAVRRGKRWESPDGRYYFDRPAADKAVDFFPTFLTHHKGEFAGKPFTLLPYQDQLIIRPLFGWKRTADDLRRFRKVFLAVPKGNGKSPLGAGIGLYLTFCDGEDGAEVYSAAADRDQAAIVFDTARIMVESNDDLREMAEVYRRAIHIPGTHSNYKVLSADATTKHGFNIHGLVFDEFHAQRDRILYETLSKGVVKRRQPVTALITTAGDDDESICAEEWDYARKVQSGTFPDDTYLPVIFEASKDDDWKDPAVWRRVNPGFGITVKEDGVANEATGAKNEPRKLNDFKRFHLNQWVNQTTAWIPVDWWDACEAPVDLAALGVLPCNAGLDMSQKYDLTALVLGFPEPIEGAGESIEVISGESEEPVKKAVSLNFRMTFLPFFWLPEDTLRERVKQDRIPYDQWRDAGLLRVTEGGSIDYDRVLADIKNDIAPRFPRLKAGQIGYDPAFATDIALKLTAAGFTPVETLQNYRHLSEPAMVLEALVKTKRARHDGNRILRNHFENVAIRSDDAGRIRPVKPKRQTKRIDGVVGSIMAVARYIASPLPKRSVYEDRGALEF